MRIDRTLAWLFVATSLMGALGCGMDAVGTGDSSLPGAPASGDHPSAGSAGGAPVDKGDAAAASSMTTVDVGADSGSAPDAGGVAMCRAAGVACSVTSDCCAGLACTGEDDDRRCR